MPDQVNPAGPGLKTQTMAQRLAKYGLNESQAFPDPVVVPKGKKLHLSALVHKELPVGYIKLVPKTMEDVKRWIGVPDSVGKSLEQFRQPLHRIPFVSSPADYEKLTRPDRRILRDIAYRYVYGDSAIYAHYLPVINNLLTSGATAALTCVCFLQDIDVLPGSVFELGTDVNVFAAGNIRIWEGGTISLLGNTSVDCTSIVGRFAFHTIPNVWGSIVNLGVLTNAEVTTHA
jgi:hypothetical protein